MKGCRDNCKDRLIVCTDRQYFNNCVMGKKSLKGNIYQTDGGYGWIVVACTFFIGFIIDGLAYSFGTLLVELLVQFKQDRASTVVIGSILTGVMYLIGIQNMIHKLKVYAFLFHFIPFVNKVLILCVSSFKIIS
jgi:hypothetical protein